MAAVGHVVTPLQRSYTVGFVPDFPVVHTIRAVKEGRDENLAKAIEVIEQAASPAAASP